MKIYCPSCSELVQAADVDLATGWAKCAACQDIFELSTVIPGFAANSRAIESVVERPFNARAVVEQSRDELDIFIPRQGFRAGTCALLGFATFWLAFIAFWTAGALGMFAGAGPPQAFNIGFAAFSIPFWLVGLGMLGGVAWAAYGTKRVKLDRNEMHTQIQCLLYSRNRTIDRSLVQRARPYAPKIQNESGNVQSSFGAEIVFEKGSFVVPADDSDEASWLVSVINDFLKT